MNSKKIFSKLGLIMFIMKSVYLYGIVTSSGIKVQFDEYGGDIVTAIVGALLFAFVDSEDDEGMV